MPQPLHNIYYKFSGLSLSKIDLNLSITIFRKIDKNAFLLKEILKKKGKEKPEAGKYKIDPLELVLLLEETQDKKLEIQNLIKKFRYQNIDLNSIYPIKIFIRYLVNFDIVVLQLDNKNFFTTEELITNLVQSDPGTPIFLNPGNLPPPAAPVRPTPYIKRRTPPPTPMRPTPYIKKAHTAPYSRATHPVHKKGAHRPPLFRENPIYFFFFLNTIFFFFFFLKYFFF